MKRFLKYFFGVLIFANIAILASGNIYLYKAFYHNFVDIDDYTIFNNRIVEAKNQKAFKTALCFRFAKTLLNLALLDSWGQFFQRPARTLKTRMDSRRS